MSGVGVWTYEVASDLFFCDAAISDVYGIAPENLATQGYGEHYLKVNTSGPEQENRRVTIRRVTALVRPVAANK